MATSVNKVILVGNLGKDPEVKATPTGRNVCTISIATSDSYKDKSSGEWVENTDWHNVVLWERLADTAGRFLTKGSKVYIEGRIKTRSYEGKDGVTRYITEVVANELVLLGANTGEGGQRQSSRSSSPAHVADNTNTGYIGSASSSYEDDDDDVPF